MWKLRVSSSIIPFQEKAEKIWGLERYRKGDYNCDLVYFGMFHIGDYKSFVWHRGKRIVVWAGGDILNVQRNYLFSDGESLWLSRLFRWVPVRWLFRICKAEHYCENNVEREALEKMKIEAEVRPSFLEDVNDFPISFKRPTWKEKPGVFLSTNDGRENEYGFRFIKRLAEKLPDIEFHLYGEVSEAYQRSTRRVSNIIIHGRVSNEQFNKEIKNYHCGLRTNEFDGFSEIIAKSVLLGQYPISKIYYPHIWNYKTEDELIRQLKRLKNTIESNKKARDFWRTNVNGYDFMGNSNSIN